MTEPSTRNKRKTVIGVVAGTAMDKTITVKAERRVMHPTFHKIVKRYTTYKAHDEDSEALLGDTVELTQCRPLSKTKFFRLTRIVRRGKAARQGVDPTGEPTGDPVDPTVEGEES